MSKHKRRQLKNRKPKISRLFLLSIIIMLFAIGIISGGIFALSSFNVNAQPNQSAIDSISIANPSPPCVEYIIPPEEPRLETVLSVDLTQEDGIPAFLEFLIVPANQTAFLDDGGIKFSKELQPGDRIQMESGRIGLIQSVETELYTPEPIVVNEKGQSLRRVLAKSKRWTDTILNLHTSTEVIETTPEHPFYVNGKWIEAKNLTPGDEIRSKDGNTIRVVKTEEVNAPQYVYNLLVEGVHNFYVGNQGLLAHNCTDVPISGIPGVNQITKGAGSDTLAGVQDFVQRAGTQQSKRPFGNKTFGGTWDFFAEQYAKGNYPGKLYTHSDSSGIIHGMMQTSHVSHSSGALEILRLEGLGQGSGAGTKLFKQAILESRQNFSGGIFLVSTEAGYKWYTKFNPTKIQGKNFYWSPEDAAKLLGQ